MEQITTAVITSVVLFLLSALFKRLSPINAAEFRTDKTVAELRKKYMKFDFLQIGLYLLMTVVLAVIYYNAFVWLSDFRVSLLDNVEIIVKPYLGAWVVGSLFTGMLTTTFAINYLGERRLKDDWPEYLAYNNLKYGFNYEKVTRVIVKVLAVICAALIIGFLDWFTAFRENDIVVNNLLGLGSKSYEYTDVTELRDVQKLEAPNGDIVEDEHYVILFNDGSKWNSRDSGFSNFERDGEIIDLIGQKTGKQVVKLEFDSD